MMLHLWLHTTEGSVSYQWPLVTTEWMKTLECARALLCPSAATRCFLRKTSVFSSEFARDNREGAHRSCCLPQRRRVWAWSPAPCSWWEYRPCYSAQWEGQGSAPWWHPRLRRSWPSLKCQAGVWPAARGVGGATAGRRDLSQGHSLWWKRTSWCEAKNDNYRKRETTVTEAYQVPLFLCCKNFPSLVVIHSSRLFWVPTMCQGGFHMLGHSQNMDRHPALPELTLQSWEVTMCFPW